MKRPNDEDLLLSAALMGPRSIDSGNISDGGITPPWLSELQWGRDRSIAEIRGLVQPADYMRRFNGAAIDRSRKYAAAAGGLPILGALQWGRDRSIAEM